MSVDYARADVARVTLKTIAEEVGVSRMTVSNAFSRPDQLSAELRERILETAERLGYAGPDATARALARGRSGVVGLLLTDSPHEAFANEVTTGLVAAITKELAPSGLAVALLAPTTGPVDPSRDLPMDGAIVYACTERSASIDALCRRGLPLVFVDQPARGPEGEVLVDDRSGARLAAQHLLDLGHREVAVVIAVGDEPRDVTDALDTLEPGHVLRERLAGWLGAFDAAGARRRVLAVPWEDDARIAAGVRSLLTRDPRPTGIVCVSDTCAEIVVRTAAELGLDVPGDLSVVGYDDAPVSRHSRVPLTTVRQDLDVKGEAAAHALIGAMRAAQAGTAEPPERVLVPTSLVVRDSTGPAPG